MPRLSVTDRLQQVLIHCNVPRDMQRQIQNAMFSPTSTFLAAQKREARTNNGWDALRDEVRAVLRGLKSNVGKQPAYIREEYEAYISVVAQVCNDIDAARCMLVKDRTTDDPDAPRVPATLADIKRMAERRNAADPENPGPRCTSQWPTWVHPETVTTVCDAFLRAYALANRGQGKRVRPFLTLPLLDYNKARLKLFRGFITSQREAMATIWPTDNPQSHVPHHALHLCALRMAERYLDVWDSKFTKDKYHALHDPLPIQWTHLLDPTMRERIRRADADPQDMSTEGLGTYYSGPTTG